MAHVELSLTQPVVSHGPRDPDALNEMEPITNLDRWAATVADADEPSLVIDAEAVIIATSRSCCALFELGDPDRTPGLFLHGGVLKLVDFTAARTELTVAEVETIPPLLALTSGRLARGLMRVQCRRGSSQIRTVDAISTPIWEGDRQAGSLTFFSEV